MLAAWEDRWRETRCRGRLPALAATRRTATDLARSAAAERLYPSLTPSRVRPEIGASFMDQLFQDCRYALRSLRHRPGFTLVALVVLGLGIGANTAIFSVVHGVLLRPLPYPEPDNLVALQRFDGGAVHRAMSQPDLEDLLQEGTFTAVAGYQTARFTLTSGDLPELVRGARTTGGLLEVFGPPPVLGRDLLPAENASEGPRVAVIGHRFWQERYGGDPGVVGTTIELAGTAYEIVGVAPLGFDFPAEAQVWTPLYNDVEDCGRGCHLMRAVARLAPAITLDNVRARIEALSVRLEAEYPKSNHAKRFLALPLDEVLVGEMRTPLLVLLGAVAIVLFIACSNVANLLLVRAARRRGEVAVRAALGARPSRIAGQLLFESLVLATAAGALGLGLAQAGLQMLVRLAPSDLPRLDEVAVDATVLGFCVAVTLVVSMLFGLAPALRLARVPVSTALRQGARGELGDAGGERLRSLLVVAEVTLSVVLLLGAGLLLRSFDRMTRIDLGFSPERLTQFTIALPEARYPDGDAAVRFFDALEQRLATLPGIEAVGSVFGSPLGPNSIGTSARFLDREPPPEGQGPGVLLRVVTPGYLETLGLPLVAGRGIEAGDRRDTPQVVVVSRRFVEEHFGDRDPLGVQVDIGVSFAYEEEAPWTIVGVVEDVRSQRLTQTAAPEMYVPEAQMGSDYLTVLVRSAAGAPDPVPLVREEVKRLEPTVALRDVTTMDTVVTEALAPARFQLVLLGAFAVLALVLAAVGLYGVVAYAVAGRTREIALRMTLGARQGQVVALVLRQGMVPLAIGLVLGLGLALGASRVLSSVLYEVKPHDPLTFAAAAGILAAVALAAAAVPASRASRIAPMVALRQD